MVWKQPLFGCFGNAGLCIVSCCTAPVSIAKNATAVNEEHPIAWVFAVMGAPCVAGALLRGQIRKQKGLEGSFWSDAGIWLCCSCCALSQESAELETMDYLVAPELNEIGRGVQDATASSDNAT